MDAPGQLLSLFDSALPLVYGYLLARSGAPDVAQSLTAETFLAAVDAARRELPARVDLPWIMSAARRTAAARWPEDEHQPEVVATSPDPVFASELRARLAGASDWPAPPTRRRRPSDVAYESLWVPDAERAGAFLLGVLGAEPAHGFSGGHERSTLFLCFSVDDVDAATAGVLDAGGGVTSGARDEPFGRVVDCVDDQGVRFAMVSGADGERGHPNGRRAGDLAYITMEVVDSVTARAFYGAVLGWRFGPGSVPDGWGVDDVVPMVGVVGHQPRPTVVPMYRVDDIGAAVARVRGAGGVASDPAREEYGVTSACVDDQRTRFWLAQFT